MRNNKIRISYVISTILVGIIVFALGFTTYDRMVPVDVYKVYVDGKVIGAVQSKKNFENYINLKEEAIKRKYNVDKVYMPNGVTIKKVTTYDNHIDSNDSIYQKLVDLRQFTILGTVIEIEDADYQAKDNSEEGTNGLELGYESESLNHTFDKSSMTKEDEKDGVFYIYTLNKGIFDEAIQSLILSFVDNDGYEAYLNSTQKAIVDTGTIIEDVDIKDKITYKKAYISIDKDIFVDSMELAKYLLYGTTEKQATYIVKEGDTVETVALANKLNVQEFLLANSDFNSENTLLYAGQEVNVGLINPVVDVVVEINGVQDEEKSFGVIVKHDPNKLQGEEFVSREGENGLYRVSRAYQYINGQLSETVTLSSTELKPTVDKVIVKGEKEIPNVADLSYWAWPTETPYMISTYFGYRWGSMHAAIDITGPAHGSPIYAANNGTVIAARSGCVPGNASCNGRRGNFVMINHNNQNYYTTYMHMSVISVKEGQVVSRGQKIGTMGNTGEVYPSPSSASPYSGTHLHFAVSRGNPLNGGGTPFDPMSLYR